MMSERIAHKKTSRTQGGSEAARRGFLFEALHERHFDSPAFLFRKPGHQPLSFLARSLTAQFSPRGAFKLRFLILLNG